MSKSPLRNVPLRIFRQYLVRSGLEHIRTTCGHKKKKKKGMVSISVPTHKDPVNRFVIANALENMGVDVDDFTRFLES
jgi:PIN domain nuclease of toxin-antitoxin system